jgi:hypothetical protein
MAKKVTPSPAAEPVAATTTATCTFHDMRSFCGRQAAGSLVVGKTEKDYCAEHLKLAKAAVAEQDALDKKRADAIKAEAAKRFAQK